MIISNLIDVKMKYRTLLIIVVIPFLLNGCGYATRAMIYCKSLGDQLDDSDCDYPSGYL